MKQIVGKVTIQERDEIKSLFERKNGLLELFKIIDGTNDVLYHKLVVDIGETSTKFQKWWDEKGATYNWRQEEGANWEINFDNCEIYLVKQIE